MVDIKNIKIMTNMKVYAILYLQNRIWKVKKLLYYELSDSDDEKRNKEALEKYIKELEEIRGY